jgi:transcriptional regulator with XRE-family HTH domain
MNSFGERLKLFAQQFGGVGKFAEATGVHPAQMSKYITGVSEPTRPIMERFAKAGLNVQWLLTGRGEMKAPTEGEEADEQGRIVYPSEIGPSAKIVGEVKVGDVVYGLVEIHPIKKKKGKKGRDERDQNQQNDTIEPNHTD